MTFKQGTYKRVPGIILQPYFLGNLSILGDHAHMKTQQLLLPKQTGTSPSTVYISGRCNYRKE
jgi:hypothetical protein